jgi:hypothetical protein
MLDEQRMMPGGATPAFHNVLKTFVSLRDVSRITSSTEVLDSSDKTNTRNIVLSSQNMKSLSVDDKKGGLRDQDESELDTVPSLTMGLSDFEDSSVDDAPIGSTLAVISTMDLMVFDGRSVNPAIIMPGSSASLPDSRVYTPPKISEIALKASSLPTELKQRRLAPDAEGKEIPLNARWTCIPRHLVSAEIVSQARFRWEARPEFIAILGILTKDEIATLARKSTEARHNRRQKHAGSISSQRDRGKMLERPMQDQEDRADGRNLRRGKFFCGPNSHDSPDANANFSKATRKREIKRKGETLRAIGIGGAAASLLSVLTEAAAGL